MNLKNAHFEKKTDATTFGLLCKITRLKALQEKLNTDFPDRDLRKYAEAVLEILKSVYEKQIELLKEESCS